jgi:hypothetical protein
MSSLKQIIAALPIEDWNYYHPNSDIQKPATFAKSLDFVLAYFNAAEKQQIISLRDIQVKSSFTKAAHTVSIYFLGCWLASKLDVKKQLCHLTFFGKEFKNDFLFVWFLSCMYHDRHFDIERPGQVKNYSDLISLNAKNKLENLLIRRRPSTVPDTLKQAIHPYYKYRQKYWCVIDHGIAAGIYLFNDLVTLRKANENTTSILDFSKSVEKLYVEAAYAIAVHNIYFPKETDIECYKKYGLTTLIGHPPINFFESPFLFLLGLTDTLDPIKTYSCISPDSVSELFLLHYSTDEDALRLVISIQQPLDFTLMANKKNDIENWLNLKFTSKPETRSIEISIPKQS